MINLPLNSNKEILLNPKKLASLISNRFGFLPGNTLVLSFDPNTYICSLSDPSGKWNYLRAGILCFVTGAKTVTLPGTPPATAKYYIYIDSEDGTLIASTTPWNLRTSTAVLVAEIYWNNTLTPKYLLASELHLADQDRAQHYIEHTGTGARLMSVGSISGLTLSPVSPTDANNTPGVGACVLADETLIHDIALLTEGDGSSFTYFVMYPDTTWKWTTVQVPFNYTADGYINYANAGVLTESINNRFVNYYLFVTNFGEDARFCWLPGTGHYTTLSTAQAEDGIAGQLAGLPIREGVLLYQVTMETGSAYTNLGKCRTVAYKTINRTVISILSGEYHALHADDETLTTIGALANSAPAATTIVNADKIVVYEAATGLLKTVAHSLNKSTLKTYNDGLYQALNGYLSDIADITPEQGDILYFDGTNWVSLAHGTAGQLLKSGGHGANPSWVTPVWYEVYTWTIPGEIKVPSGATDYLGPKMIYLETGQTAKIAKVYSKIYSGTSVTLDLYYDGSGATGFTGMSVVTGGTTTDPTDLAVVNAKEIRPVVTGVSGTPTWMTVNVVVQITLLP